MLRRLSRIVVFLGISLTTVSVSVLAKPKCPKLKQSTGHVGTLNDAGKLTFGSATATDMGVQQGANLTIYLVDLSGTMTSEQMALIADSMQSVAGAGMTAAGGSVTVVNGGPDVSPATGTASNPVVVAAIVSPDSITSRCATASEPDPNGCTTGAIVNSSGNTMLQTSLFSSDMMATAGADDDITDNAIDHEVVSHVIMGVLDSSAANTAANPFTPPAMPSDCDKSHIKCKACKT